MKREKTADNRNKEHTPADTAENRKNPHNKGYDKKDNGPEPPGVTICDSCACGCLRQSRRYEKHEQKKAEKALQETKHELEKQAWGLEKTNESIKLLYKELEEKNKELQKLDQLKSDFVSTVSHELRTPLTTMKEFVSIISDEIPGKLNKEQREYVDIVKSNIDRLARLINDLLDISRIEAG